MSKPPTIQEQADFLWLLRRRCEVADGEIAGNAWLYLDRADIEEIERLRLRLERMAPFEDRIRQVVTGRR